MQNKFPKFSRRGKNFSLALLALGALFVGGIVTYTASAQSTFTNQINYQGKLTDAANLAVPDGTYNMAFRLYTSPTSATTTNIWEEVRTSSNRVSVSNGLFSVMLGSVTSFPTNFNWNQSLYLGVEIGSSTASAIWDGEMSPRKTLGAVPAAFDTTRFGGLATTSFVRTDATSTIQAASAQTLLALNQTGAGNLFDTQTSGVSKFVVTNSGNVGVGTSSPFARLSVAGLVVADSFNATNTNATSTFAGGVQIGNNFFVNDAAGPATSIYNADPGGYLILGVGPNTFNSQLRLDYLGRVSVGVGSDAAAFTVGSDVAGANLPQLRLNMGGLARWDFSATTTGGNNLIINSGGGGKIGLGTNTPSEYLSVGGSVLSSGVFKSSSTTATSTFQNGIQLSGGCYRNAQGDCVGRGVNGTYIVAAYNSRNKNFADYVTDFNNDQTEINQAITAAYSASRGLGGKVYLLEGDYRISTSSTNGAGIQMATGTALQGSGPGTVLIVASSTPGSINLISLENISGVSVSEMTLDGNRANQSAGTQAGVRVSQTSTSTIKNLHVRRFSDQGISFGDSHGNEIGENVIENNGGDGIQLIHSASGSYRNIVEGNTVNTNGGDGIYLYGYGTSENIISVNVFNRNTGSGINIANSGSNTIGQNIIYENMSHGIELSGSGAVAENTITGNSISLNGASGIALGDTSNQNTVTGNTLRGNGGAGAAPGIHVYGAATDNIISSNIINDDSGSGPAILVSGDSPRNTLIGNTYTGIGARVITDFATGTTRYTQWDRITLDTRQSGSVAHSLLSIYGSSSIAIASTTQMGTGKVLSLNNTTGEVFTVANNGNIGIGTSSPYARLSVAGVVAADSFHATNTNATSTFSGDVRIGDSLFFSQNGGPTGRIYNPLSGFLEFGTNNINNQLVLDYNGRVGIGTNIMSATFEVWGDNTSPTFRLYNAGVSIWDITATQTPQANLEINRYAAGPGDVTIGGGAGLGIGTTTPSARLAVSGDIFATGTIRSFSTTATSTFANGIQLSGGCFRNAQGQCIGAGANPDGKAATYIVAAYNSINKQYADYIADFSNDQTEINQAITAAYSASRGTGGKVYLLEGDYRISTSSTNGAAIVMATGTQLQGSGPGTVLIVASSTQGNIDVISASTTPPVVISDLTINGNKGNQTTGTHRGVHVFGVSGGTLSTTTVDRLILTGLRTEGVAYAYVTGGSILSTHFTDIGVGTGNAIEVSNSLSVVISHNVISDSDDAIEVVQTQRSSIAHNTLYQNSGRITLNNADNNTVIGNTIDASTGDGISLFSSSQNTVANNVSSNHTSSGSGIFVDTNSDSNAITGNILSNNAGPGISISNTSVGNLLSGNSITDTTGTTYAIRISSNSTGNTLVGNTYSGVGASSIGDFATGTTKYTQWDRITLDTRQLGEVSNTLLSIYGSSSIALASTTQMGTGKILSLNSSTTEVFTVLNGGNVGIGTSSPIGTFSIAQTNGYFNVGKTGAIPSTYLDIVHGASQSASVFRLGGLASGDLLDVTAGSGMNIYQPTNIDAISSSAYALSVNQQGTGALLNITRGSVSVLTIPNNDNIGIGTSSPWARLSVAGSSTLATQYAFAVSNIASTTLFSIANNGQASSTNLIVSGTATTSALAVTGSATSTFSNGIQLSGGCYRNAQGDCVGRGVNGTYIVAAYNSRNKNFADYVTDFNNDQTEINSAITAAYSASRGAGGKVYLLEGDFRLGTSTASGDSIVMASSTALIGSGPGTVLYAASSTPGDINLIAFATTSNALISDFTLNGNRANQSAGTHTSVLFTNSGSSTITRIAFRNSYGVTIEALSMYRTVVSENSFEGAGDEVIRIQSGGDNIFAHNWMANINDRGFNISSDRTQITDNNIRGGLLSPGIQTSGNDGVVSGNIVMENSQGILLVGSASGNTIMGNTVVRNTNEGIILLNSASGNVISGNTITDNGSTGNVSGISLTSTNINNTIANNRIIDTAGTGYAIFVSPTATNNTLVGNTYSGTGASSIGDFATGTTKYTQWDRITLDTKSLGQVANSLLSIYGSSSVALASTTQLGTGNVLSLNNATGEVFTVANGGNVGVGTSSPYARLSVAGQIVGQYFTATGTATSTLAGGITIAGTASTTGLLVTGSFLQNGLTDCTGSANKVTYTLASGKFGCDTDQTGGGGINTGALTIGNLIATTSFIANSALLGSTTVGSLTATGTITANALAVSGTATSTFQNGIQLSGGCFRDTNATSTCIGRGQSATYVVAAQNSKHKQYADYIADGSNDQNEINNAITAAYSSTRLAGGKVYLLEGDYVVSSAIELATSTALVGSGNGTRIILASSSASGASVIHITTSSTTVSDLFIDGNRGNQSNPNYGVHIHGPAGSTFIQATMISRVSVYNVNGDGLHVVSTPRIVTVAQSDFHNNDVGMQMQGYYWTVIGNQIEANTTAGITFDAIAQSTVSGNLITTNGAGITDSGYANRMTITGNTIAYNTGSPITLNGAPADITFTGNNLHNNSGAADIIFANGSGFSIIGNQTQSLLSLNAVTDSTISGNKFDSSNLAGVVMFVNGSSRNIFNGNTVKQADVSGPWLRIDGTSLENTISSNTLMPGTPRVIIDYATSSTRYTQWDRITLNTQGNTIQPYSLLSLIGSSSVALASTTQLGTGKILSLNSATSGEAFTVTNDGKVGVGTSSPFTDSLLTVGGTTTISAGTQGFAGLQIFNGGLCVDADGFCTASTAGRVSAVSYTTGNTDLAELFSSLEQLEPGEIVMTAVGTNIMRAKWGEERKILGVVATAPGVLLGLGNDSSPEGKYPVALAGRVPVKVNLEGGSIVPGDAVSVSMSEGVGMRARGGNDSVGVALEGFNESSPKDEHGVGTVLVLVNLSQYANLREGIASSEYSLLDPFGGRISLFGFNATTSAVEYRAPYPIDLGGQAIRNIASLTASSGKWSLDENGLLVVERLEASEVQTNKLCVDDVCITADQLRALLQSAGSNSTPSLPQSSQSPAPLEVSPLAPESGTGSSTPPITEGSNLEEEGGGQPTVPESSQEGIVLPPVPQDGESNGGESSTPPPTEPPVPPEVPPTEPSTP